MRGGLSFGLGLVVVAACSGPGAPIADAGPDALARDAASDTTTHCNPIHVSPAGADDQSGCSPSTAKRTISAAILAAASSGAASPQVMVCHGVYDENVLLNASAVSLEGGFDCSQFARLPGYGYPTFDATNETIVSPSGGSALEVTGAIGSGVTIDGFTFPGSPADNSPAVSIHDGPSLVLSNNRVVGGSGSGYGTGSTGLDIRKAGPDISHNAIDGGSGTTSTEHIYGSIGIYLEGPAHIHENRITGGTGTLGGDPQPNVGQTASMGLVASGADLTGALAIQGNMIDAGHGTSLGTPTNFDVEGVAVLTGSVDLLSNTISGGDWACSGFCAKTAVSTLQSNAVRLEGNRIYGGGGGSASAGVQAVTINNSKSVEIVNNMIHSGNREGTSGATAGGISLAYVSNAFVAHNTLFLASSSGSGFHSFPTSLVQQFIVENNLFLSAGQGTALDLWRCNGLAVLSNNAFSPMTTILQAHGSNSCPGDNNVTTIAATESLVVSDGGNAQGNVTISATCSSSACATVTGCGSGGDQCAEALLDGFGASDLGFSGLMSGKWGLAASPPCKISQGGMDLTSQVQQDAFGVTRTPPVSIGAAELDGPCTP